MSRVTFYVVAGRAPRDKRWATCHGDLIRAIVDAIDPQPTDTVVDQACGSAASYSSPTSTPPAMPGGTPHQREHLRDEFVSGYELADGTARLAAVNLLLHGIETPNGDSLIADPGQRWSVALTNPPFGRKSSLTMVGAGGLAVREDRHIEGQGFVVTTSNKQRPPQRQSRPRRAPGAAGTLFILGARSPGQSRPMRV